MEKSTEVKYPFFKAFVQPFSDILYCLPLFLKYGMVAAFVLWLTSILFFQTFLCALESMPAFLACRQSVATYGLYFFIKLYVLAVFIKVWYDASYLQKQINIAYFKNHLALFTKIYLGLILFLVVAMLPILSGFLLYQRHPSPVFQKELGYFFVVSLLFWVPFVLMRFYANLASLIEGRPLFSFAYLWQRTSSQTPKIVLSFVLLVFVVLILFMTSIIFLQTHSFGHLALYNLLSEYIVDLLLVLITAIVTNFVKMQKDLFGPK